MIARPLVEKVVVAVAHELRFRYFLCDDGAREQPSVTVGATKEAEAPRLCAFGVSLAMIWFISALHAPYIAKALAASSEVTHGRITAQGSIVEKECRY